MNLKDILSKLHKIDYAQFTPIPEIWKFHDAYPNVKFTLFGTKKSFLTTVLEKGSRFSMHKFETETILSRGIVIDIIVHEHEIERLSDEDQKWTVSKSMDEDYKRIKAFYEAFGHVYFLDYNVDRIIEGIDKLA